MANNSNVSNATYPYDSYPSSFLVGKNANIDANYGPWESILDYETWHGKKTPSQIKEGTLIAIKASDSSDVTLYIRSNGTWKPVGSGGTGTDDIGYVPDNVEVQLLNKQVVSTSANQGLDTPQKVNARNNIGAASADDLNNNYYKKSETYTKSEIDDSISQIQAASGGDLSGYYNKVQVNDKLDLKADKANTVTTNTNQTTDENGPITGDKSFTGNVDFSKKTWISEVILQGNTVFKGKDQLLNDNTVIIESSVKFPNLDPGILTIDNSSEHKVVTVPASSFISSPSAYITPDWNNNTEGTNGYIAHKPDLNDYLTKSGGNITGTLAVSGKISGSNGIEILGDATINGTTNIGTSTNQKDLIVSKDATVENDFVVKGNVSLGTDTSSTAKTITLGSTTGAGNVADNININGIITSDVTIGKANPIADNKNLTVNGNATLTSAGIGNCSIAQLSLPHENFTANSILKLDSNKKVVSDTGIFMKYKDEVNSYADLPDENAEGISKGDVIYVKDNDTFVIASSITNDNNLYVRIPGLNLVTLDKTTQPAVSYSSVKTDLYRVHEVFSAYPLIDYYYHTLPAGSDGRLRVIPITTNIEGEYALVLASTQKIFAVTTQDSGGPKNSWYCTGLDNTGEVKDITSSFSTSDNSVQRFKYLLNSVVWTGTKDYVEDNAIKFAPQTLTETQKVQAVENIAAERKSVDVSGMFDEYPELPEGYTMAQLQERNLYATINGNRYPVTLKYSSSTNSGMFFYVDYDGTDMECISSPVNLGNTVYVSGVVQDTNENPIVDITLHFVPTNSSQNGVSFSGVDVSVLPDSNGSFTANLKTGATYYITVDGSSDIVTTIDHPYYTTDAVTGFNITLDIVPVTPK